MYEILLQIQLKIVLQITLEIISIQRTVLHIHYERLPNFQKIRIFKKLEFSKN